MGSELRAGQVRESGKGIPDGEDSLCKGLVVKTGCTELHTDSWVWLEKGVGVRQKQTVYVCVCDGAERRQQQPL